MGRILKKRPESAPSNWQAVLTEMEIHDAVRKIYIQQLEEERKAEEKNMKRKR